MEHEVNECFLLQRTIYGVIQSAIRQFFKKLTLCLRTMGFVGKVADLCLMMRQNNKGIVFFLLYVDNCYCCRHKGVILDTIQQLKVSGFGVKVEDNLMDYLSCNIVFDKENNQSLAGSATSHKYLPIHSCEPIR
jgi:hypothetical protein